MTMNLSKRCDFEVGDKVRVDALERSGTVAEIDNGRIALKFTESDCIFWSPCELVRRDVNQAKVLSDSGNKKADSLTEILNRENGVDGTDLVPELERSSIALDRDILKWQNLAEKINEQVIIVEEKLNDMEKKIKADESGIELLTQQSIMLASELSKIEPEYRSIRKVWSSIAEVKRENANIRSSLLEAGKKIERMESGKERLELNNEELRVKATLSVKKWKSSLTQRKIDTEEGVNHICESIRLLNVDNSRLTKNLDHETMAKEQKINNLQAAKDLTNLQLLQKEGVKEKLKILNEETSALIEKITFLEKAIAMLARGKAFKFVPTINIIEEFLSNLEKPQPERFTEEGMDSRSLGRIISDLCSQNNALKLELSEATSKLLKVMVESSTSDAF